MSTILVVEDHPTNRKLVRDVLQRAGYIVLEAGRADQGIRIAREKNPKLVVMDIQLPGMDGLTATRLLKENSSTRDIPVVALTAHAMPGDRKRFKEGGCDAYLTKPLRYRELLSVVERLLKGDCVEFIDF